MPLKRHTAANGKCRAKTKAGRHCANAAVRDGIYCAIHTNPERAAQLGRKGGVRGARCITPCVTSPSLNRPAM